VTEQPDRFRPPEAMTLPRVPDAAALSSSEFGLALGLILGRFFLDMQDLHYGYWPPDLPPVPQHLSVAQAAYTDVVMSYIPKSARSVLDVGCGAGNTARKLLEGGYQVDGVSPNSFLTAVARQVLGDRAAIFETKFQDLVTERRYDVVLFSESLLFMPREQAFAKALQLLHPGGTS
jgi:2-polyprenyl-3-methyl-5-hydroxy-6-metoxy-1,4-benzoquinol methylase